MTQLSMFTTFAETSVPACDKQAINGTQAGGEPSESSSLCISVSDRGHSARGIIVRISSIFARLSAARADTNRKESTVSKIGQAYSESRMEIDC